MLDIILSNNRLTVSDFGSIRITEEGWISIYDLIRVCCESANRRYPSNNWNALIARYSEDLSDKRGHLKQYKFPGKGQRITPICDRQTALKIIGLLPGEAGKKYRDAASKLVLEYFQDPEALANRAVDRMEELGDTEGLERHKVRVENKLKRIKFTDELIARGVEKPYHYANITNGMTKDVLGKTATQIKKENNVKSARDAMDKFELAVIGASESLATAFMIRKNASGYRECNEESRKASKNIGKMIEE